MARITLNSSLSFAEAFDNFIFHKTAQGVTDKTIVPKTLSTDNLIKIANDIDTVRIGKPAFLMVMTKNKVADQMGNGVYVVPLCCLKN